MKSKLSIGLTLMLVALVLSFMPAAGIPPQRVSAASTCDWAQFIADVTVPDGTSFSAGATFNKTWRLKNIGNCTWTTSYALVFDTGQQMGAPASINFPSSVAPGQTVDLTLNMTAPSAPGHYIGYWKFKNASGVLFGIGTTANKSWWVDINVSGGGGYGVFYDFTSNLCQANWYNDTALLPCPGTDGSASGFALKLDNPVLENNVPALNPGILTSPQQIYNGVVDSVYPAMTIQTGDKFQVTVGCQNGAVSCYARYFLQYKTSGGNVYTLWTWNEKYEGLSYNASINLDALAGQNVSLILGVRAYGSPTADRALWIHPVIVRPGAVPTTPVPITPGAITPQPAACDRAQFIADVTVPDGTMFSPNTSFIKTWRIKNVGTCTWSTSYALIFDSGDKMAGPDSAALPNSVVPGQTVDLTINLTAPSSAGSYRGYWRFKNASGVPFGIGMGGTKSWWVDIRVTGSAVTPTVSPTPTVTPGTIPPGTSVTTINADAPDPSVPLQSVAVSVTVSGSGAAPTGTVAISGADTNCSITLSSGSGSCNVIFNSTGSKSLTATYSGSGSYSGSSSTTSHTVKNAVTTTINADTPDPSRPGQTVAVNVTVSGAGATPTGTVTISGADTNCTLTLSSGSGTCSVVFNTTGAKTITATYNGDANYVGSSVDTESHTVTNGSTTTTITAHTPDPSAPNALVTVSVSVLGGGATPTGTVSIGGADTNCAITLVNGTGSCNVIFNTIGSKTLSATYNGDGNYLTSVAATVSHTVRNATTTTITADNPDPSTLGAAVTVSVTVSGAGATPTGTVDISGADTNCSLTLTSGSGSCNVVFNSAGAKIITATYNGDVNYAGSSGSTSHTVIQGSTTTITIVDTPDPSAPYESVNVTVTVAGSGATPTGTVAITGADTSCTLTLSGGTGSCSVVFNTSGSRTLTATYSGDGNYASSSNTALHNAGSSSVPPPFPAGGYKFDFGTSGSPIYGDYTRVTDTTAYPTANSTDYPTGSAYGWTSTSGLVSDVRTPFDGTFNNLTIDLVHSTTPHIFKVDLPNGTYHVTITMGDRSNAHDHMVVKANGTTILGDVNTAAGTVYTSSSISVSIATTNSLELEFSDNGGPDLSWVVNGVTIMP